MVANFFFFSTLLFIIGGLVYFYLKKTLLILFLISILLFYYLSKKFFLSILISMFLFFGYLYSFFYGQFFIKQNQDYIKLEREISPTSYKRFLVSFKGEKYIAYLPIYLDVNPKDKIFGKFEIDDNRIYFSKIEKVEKSIFTPIFSFRKFLSNLINESYSFNSSQIISGILYGEEIKDRELYENFINSGLSHITAMSGYNLTLIYSFFQDISKFLPLGFITKNLISIILIILFIIFAGFQSSVIRAGIMISFLILGKILGRVPLRRNILVLPLLFVFIFDPKAIMNDIGFQLSFFAVLGILYLKEPLEKFLKIKIFSELISAQIMTLPLIWYQFGNLNLFSFFNNLLIIPLVPIFMLLGFLSIFIIFLNPLNQLINLPFEFLAKLINILGKFPKIYMPVPLIVVILIYSFVLYLIYKFNKDESIDFNFNLA